LRDFTSCAHHAYRAATLNQPQTVWAVFQYPIPRRERNLRQQLELAGHLGQPRLAQPQPVDQRLGHPGLLGCGDVGGVGGKHLGGRIGQPVCHGVQCGVDRISGGGS
jgi:hypothetical protein